MKLSPEQFSQTTRKIDTFNCVKSPIKKRGFFKDFYDFRDQFIDTTITFETQLAAIDSTDKDKKITQNQVFINAKNPVLPWAYCDGENYFYNVDSSFYEMRRFEDSYYVDFFIPKSKQKIIYFPVITSTSTGASGGAVANITLGGIGTAVVVGAAVVVVAAALIYEALAEKNTQNGIFELSSDHGNLAMVESVRHFDKYLIVNDLNSEKTPIYVDFNGKKRKINKKRRTSRKTI